MRPTPPPWFLAERVGSQPRGKPPTAPLAQAPAGVTPRVEGPGGTRRPQRRPVLQRPHPPQSTPARLAASVRRETEARVSAERERQHVRPPSRESPREPSREPPRTAPRHPTTRQRAPPDRLRLLGPSRETPHRLRRPARRRASAHPARRKQPQTWRVARDRVGRCRPAPHPLGQRLVGQSRHRQNRLERDL